MDQAEYDRRFKRQVTEIGSEPKLENLAQEPIIVDGGSVAPLRITLVNSTPQELYAREMELLQETVEVVGYTSTGVKLVRRRGGADYAGNEEWRQLMRRCGRLR